MTIIDNQGTRNEEFSKMCRTLGEHPLRDKIAYLCSSPPSFSWRRRDQLKVEFTVKIGTIRNLSAVKREAASKLGFDFFE